MTNEVPPDLPTRLRELAELIKGSDRIDSQMQRSLAELLEELSGEVNSREGSDAARSHLAETLEHLVSALQQEQEHSPIQEARDRVLQAAVDAETYAPLAAGLTRRLLDLLTNAGV